MKSIKKLFGIKTTYAIPSDNGVDITKCKKYKVTIKDNFIIIKDDAKVKLCLGLNELMKDGKLSHNYHCQIITE